MTTFADILAFVKSMARIAGTESDARLGLLINAAYRGKAKNHIWPGLRATASFSTVAGTRDYALAADFVRLIEHGVRYDTAGANRILPIVNGMDVEIWNAMEAGTTPRSCMVAAGSLRLMPGFTESGKTVEYAYLKRPATLSGTDALEAPELAEAVAWDVLASDKSFCRDNDAAQADWMRRAKSAYLDAVGTLP